MRNKIKDVLKRNPIGEKLTVKGWVKSVRDQKNFAFIEINDGSCFANMQGVLQSSAKDLNIADLTTGCAVAATGTIVSSPSSGQKIEMQIETIDIIGKCDSTTYPLQKKRHSFEFLRTIAHLRPRTNTQGAVMRLRNCLAFATHKFFQERGFFYIHTPIITASDCEGAGELFQITTLDLEKLPKNSDGTIDYNKDFFNHKAYLTVSGQLNVETFCAALGDVYTFGPTFRAELSNTFRHLAEFWMIEPELAFADLNDDMECAESYLKYVIKDVFENAQEELKFFDSFIEKGLIDRLQTILNTPFERITYTDAVDILQKSSKKFDFPVTWGGDLKSEHERFLTEEHFKKPLIVTNYPESLKAFYMRDNDDGKTVAAMDILVPKIGELVGGSQREERLNVLEKKLARKNLNKENYSWYLDLRRFGSTPHAGFGVGFERLIQFTSGIENIRDVIPFPRYPGHAEY